MIFFFKQKTAYEMRISDWSSDVCSSDLGFAWVCPAATKRSHDWIRHCAMVEPVALLALALDAEIGWPQAIYRRVGHPVGIFARAILWCELRWKIGRASCRERVCQYV